jgi:hypothetical protein
MNGRNEYPKQGLRYLVTAIVLGVALQGTNTVQAQELVWAKQADGSPFSSTIGHGIAVDSAGNSYVTGSFGRTAIFGPGESNETTLVTATAFLGDIFVAKYTPNGALVWAKQVDGTSGDTGYGIAVDSQGQSYVTGEFNGSAIFGPGEPNETTLVSTTGSDIFVAKYASNGALVWAKRVSGLGYNRGLAIAVDGSGNSYVTGHLNGSVAPNVFTFGPGEPNEITLTIESLFGIFVAKYNSSGGLVWAKKAAEGGIDMGQGIAVDGNGNSYVTGFFTGLAIFGMGESSETTLMPIAPNSGERYSFVAKYSPNGALIWAKRFGAGLLGGGDTESNSLAVDSLGQSYVTGHFEDSAIFGFGEPNEITLGEGIVFSGGIRVHFDNIFVAKYTTNGALVWAKRADGTNPNNFAVDNAGAGIAVDGNGNSYVTGRFVGSGIFGPGEANETTLMASGKDDIFVAKYAQSGNLVWATQAGGESKDWGLGIALDGARNTYVTGRFEGSAVFGQGEDNEISLVSGSPIDNDRLFVAKLSGSGSGSLTFKDVNGDGRADFIWRNTSSGVVAVWLMNGTAIALSGFPAGVPLVWQIAGVGDVNGDGKADVIWRNSTSGTVAVWLMNGLTITSVGFPGSTSTDWEIEQVGDVDGNGTADLVWRNTNSGVVAVWLMNGATILSSGFLGGVPAVWQIAGIGDVNSDGQADVIWRNDISGTVAVWLMNGLTISSVGFPGSASTDWTIKGVGDFDGDGKSDLIWKNDTSDIVAIWLLNGTSLASSGVLGGIPSALEIEQVGDMNGDGRADVVLQNTASGEVTVWLMDGLAVVGSGSPGTVSTDWEIQD